MQLPRLCFSVKTLLTCICATSSALAASPSISDDRFQSVVARLAEAAQKSWELGTRAQALLELDAPFFSVFSGTIVPPPHSAPKPSDAFDPADLTDVLAIARTIVQNQQQSQLSNNSDPNEPRPLIPDGSAGDPASLGVAVLLANWTLGNDEDRGLDYAAAAEAQLQYLLDRVPRANNGAISHRVSQVQLWADFIYMVPPFLAYYGALTSNLTLLQLSHQQISAYRSTLLTEDVGLWKHIIQGDGDAEDGGHWSTGNAWAAAGMLRVLATMDHLKDGAVKSALRDQRRDLGNWVSEILDGMYRHLPDSSIFHNYADDDSTFQDASSTALIAATTYRLALLTRTFRHLPNAEKCRAALSSNNHIDSSGWLQPVVNPLDWSVQGSHSPEGQAFVVLMQAAWNDWVAEGSPGKNDVYRLGVPITQATSALMRIFTSAFQWYSSPSTGVVVPTAWVQRIMCLCGGMVWAVGISAVKWI